MDPVLEPVCGNDDVWRLVESFGTTTVAVSLALTLGVVLTIG